MHGNVIVVMMASHYQNKPQFFTTNNINALDNVQPNYQTFNVLIIKHWSNWFTTHANKYFNQWKLKQNKSTYNQTTSLSIGIYQQSHYQFMDLIHGLIFTKIRNRYDWLKIEICVRIFRFNWCLLLGNHSIALYISDR